MSRTGNAAARAARTRVWAPAMCLNFARTMLGVGPRYPSAAAAWARARYKHHDAHPPPGVPVWWTGGRFGHVAISAGSGYVWSTDWPRRGRVGRVAISELSRRWRKTYAGWSEDINGTRVTTAATHTPPAGGVALAHLHYGIRHPDVTAAQRALLAAGRSIPAGATGYYGDQTDAAVRADQTARGWRPDRARRSFIGPRQAAALGLRAH